MPNDVARIDLRLPPELHARIAALAAREHRSINAQLVHLIEEATKPQQEISR